MTDEYPLVGLHGYFDYRSDRVIDLGVIWFDTNNSNCKRQMTAPPDMHSTMTAEEAFKKMTSQERQKGKDVEELLMFHSLI